MLFELMSAQPVRMLCLGAHADDIEFGCGGTIAKFAGVFDMFMLVLSDHVMADRERLFLKRDLSEQYAAIKRLGVPTERVKVLSFPSRFLSEHRQEIRNALTNVKKEFRPHIVLCPSVHDLHQDHPVVGEEACRVFREFTVLGYEIIRSSLTFTPELHVALAREHVRKKAEAVACYKSQADPNVTAGYYFAPEAIEAAARMRGLQFGLKYAEAFEVYYMKW